MEDWSKDLAKVIAKEENIELGDKHWDLIKFLRDEYIANAQNHAQYPQYLSRRWSTEWGEKVSQKDVYALFPGDPSKQGGRIAGVPESRRKGGY